MAQATVTNPRAASRALQAWLNAHGAKLKEDGVLGPITRSHAVSSTAPFVSDMLKAAEADVPVPSSDDREMYWPAVRAKARALGVSESLVDRFVRFESGWRMTARSTTGAVGLFQLTSWPVRQYNQDVPAEVPLESRSKPEVNIEVGVWYVRYCAQQVGVDPMSASDVSLARVYGAFNLGPGAFKLWESGQHRHPTLVNAWKTQATALKRGGIQAYLANVQQVLA